MFIDVLTRVSADTGLGIVQKREVLNNILHVAAKEIHSKLECNSIYREVSVVVPPNKIIALPSIIGDIKGMRLSEIEQTVELHGLTQPKYVLDVSLYKFRNWRDLGESPVHTLPANVGPISFYPKAIETTPITIKISGPTNLGSKIEESVIISSLSGHSTIQLFDPNIDSITCAQKRNYDIIIKDSAGTEIAVLYNTFDKTRYKLIDVSEYSWPSDTVDDEFIMDICYKKPAIKLVNDSDSFYAGDEYDEAWYCMAMHIFLDPLQNRKDESLMFRAKCADLLQSTKDSKEKGIMKQMVFGPNKYYNLFPSSY